MTTEYKGFNLTFVSNGITINSGRYFVVAEDHTIIESFNTDGYATLNAAKGAITKHLKDADIGKFLERVTSLPATIENKDRASVPVAVSVVRSRNQREGGYAGSFHSGAGHKRAGKNRLYTLKENARYNKSLDQGE